MNIRFDCGEVITAMATPFNEKLEVDYIAAEKLAKHLANNGSDAILVAGTTGESPTLTHEEELNLLTVVKEAVGNKAKIVMGAGSNSTVTAVEMSKKVQEKGADAILSVVPYYNKPSQKGLLEHFGQIASATDLPIILYNIPGRTGINMLPETIATLAQQYSNIIAVKQSNPDLDLVTEIIDKSPKDFIVYSGDDSLTLPMLSLGAHGVISVASHLIGTDIKEMIQKFKSGDVKGAQTLQYKCFPLFKALFTAPNPTPLKACLQEWNIIEEYVRSPLVTLTNEEKNKLFKVLSLYQKISV
ncbi:MAG: 4-hydroxy-tetrahydrodipicolinate synthase [Candidatus Melainabacteria bacterium RIFOXYA12_FULL_32_12]|nr:MAG: 4-hydroxy-tetrahydrodipicolinate synthase [Candidatus Melainabacteria bacterium RIFOXYA2_FULL_32_9]OGI30961.1 MAG: 4-hydroxy-tetrahydrodipicolinate synthase [Candidatus Melainabacteria bacterium RIFOXYA12_FULL_32_12]